MGVNLSKGGASNHPIRSFSYLPDLIIAEIISGLPIQSILRCRCVCKSWLHLISSSYFNNIKKRRLSLTFVLEGGNDFFLFEFQHRTDLAKATRYPVKPLKLNSELFPDTVSVVGIYNGLFCLLDLGSSVHRVHLWNPVLNEYITFSLGYLGYGCRGYGFGYNHLTYHYKLLRIIDCGETYSVIEVFTLGCPNTTWRRVGKTHARPHRFFSICFFTGIAHWISDVDSHAEWICSFNFITEQVGFISPPPGCTSCKPHRATLILEVVRDCFCVLNGTIKGFVLWSMKDYGVAESWSKYMVFEFPNSSALRGMVFITRMWEDEEFLFFQGFDNLGYFDSKKIQYVELKSTIDDIYLGKHATYLYFPSFVPLFEVFREEPLKLKMLTAEEGRFHLLLSKLRNYFCKRVLL